MTYYCDQKRHLVCVPYSIDNLHKMAEDLGIHKCFYHEKGKTGIHAHYDIPKLRLKEIMSRCTVVSKKQILRIIKQLEIINS